MNHNLISPLLTSALDLSPMRDREAVDGGATRLIDRHSSMYLVPTGSEADEYVLIDGGMDKKARRLEEFLTEKGLGLAAIKAVFLTHAHADHVGALHATPDTLVYVSEPDSKVLSGAARSEGLLPGMIDKLTRKSSACVPDLSPEIISHEQEITIGSLAIQAIAMEGHTSGSMGYLVSNNVNKQPSTLFVGDALDFKKDGSVANAASPFSSDTDASHQSILTVVRHLRERDERVGAVVPAHSGTGTFLAMEAYATEHSVT